MTERTIAIGDIHGCSTALAALIEAVIVGHTAQRSGDILDLGFVKCIDTFCHGGEWLTALEVGTEQVWQANEEGERRAWSVVATPN